MSTSRRSRYRSLLFATFQRGSVMWCLIVLCFVSLHVYMFIFTGNATIRLNNRPIIRRHRLIQKKLILLSYLSYLFRLRLWCKDSYLLEGLQSADKTKTHPTAKLQNAPSLCHVCLLLLIKIKTCTYQLCKRQSADTNVLIGQYRLLADYQIQSCTILEYFTENDEYD